MSGLRPLATELQTLLVVRLVPETDMASFDQRVGAGYYGWLEVECWVESAGLKSASAQGIKALRGCERLGGRHC
jgi:hypothetical protein